MTDMMIAGVAAHGAALATRNRRDFADLGLTPIAP
jgi:predicted nucleic acid-binding protein